MHLTAPSNWSRSIGTGGRDPSEQVVTIAGMRIAAAIPDFPGRPAVDDRFNAGTPRCCTSVQNVYASMIIAEPDLGLALDATS